MSFKDESVGMTHSEQYSDTAIDVKGLSKCYQVYEKPKDRLKQAFNSLIASSLRNKTKQYYREFWALQDISVKIKKGETVGIIGLNGSGKSTLLQLICGTLTPTTGSVEVNGRVAALLELGSGFNMEFTGKENILMYASVFGLSQDEIKSCYDDIVNFADIGEFIDQSLKTYSSGMVVRLAFSVIAHINADILVIDEALSVGDVVFNQKCMNFLRSFKKKGTLLFVSHDISAVQNLCDRSIWIDQGKIKKIGSSKEISQVYLKHTLQSIYGESEQLEDTAEDVPEDLDDTPTYTEEVINYESNFSFNDNLDKAKGWKTNAAEITSVNIHSLSKNKNTILRGGEHVRLIIKALTHQDLEKPIIGFVVKDRLGQDLFGENTLVIKTQETAKQGSIVRAEFDFMLPMLPNGDYAVMASIADGDMEGNVQHHFLHDACIIKVWSSKVRWGLVGLRFDRVILDTSSEKK